MMLHKCSRYGTAKLKKKKKKKQGVMVSPAGVIAQVAKK